MANFKEDAVREYDWESGGVYVIEPEDPVEGGAEGVSNRQGRELALRTRNLHERLDELKRDTTARADELAEAINTKDAEALKMAKEYADRIVAELTDSAPEALDTLKELAAALGDDPNFSATVMELIGERVTAEAMAEALEGKMNAALVKTEGDCNDWTEPGKVYYVSFDYIAQRISNAPCPTAFGTLYIPSGEGVQLAFTYRDGLYLRSNSWDNGWGAWRKLWHSGNFNPNSKQDGTLNLPTGTDLNTVQTTGTFDVFNPKNSPIAGWVYLSVIKHTGGANWVSQTLYSFGESNVMNGIYHRCGTLNDKWSNWVELCHSGNIKPTYYAQIDPNGNVISKSADWIQSVTWNSDGYGVQCYIVPKVAVNMSTVHITKVKSRGNTFSGYTPIVFDELIDGAIVVAIPDGVGRGEVNYFNISIQGA